MPKYKCKTYPTGVAAKERFGRLVDGYVTEAADEAAASVRVLINLGIQLVEVPEVDFRRSFIDRIMGLILRVQGVAIVNPLADGPGVGGIKVWPPSPNGRVCVSYRGVTMFFNEDGTPREGE